MRSDIRKMKSCGFGLVEMLIVIVILGILAGISFVAFGRGTDGTEAAAIMANLDSAKNALLGYSMEHRTRNTDPLITFVNASSNTINTSLDKYLDANTKSGSGSAARHFQMLAVRGNPPASPLEVGFEGIVISSGLKRALDQKIPTSGMYSGGGETNAYSIWLRVR